MASPVKKAKAASPATRQQQARPPDAGASAKPRSLPKNLGSPDPKPGFVQSIINRLKIATPEGARVGQILKLLPFQEQIVAETLFNRKTRTAILSFARKNGKTTLAALIAVLASLGIRVKNNSLIVIAARSRDQATICFDAACRMTQMSPVLNSMFSIRETKKELTCLRTGIIIRAISAEATTAFGLSPALAIHDEVGQVKGPKDALFEAIETAMGAHEDPLSFCLSTQAPTDDALLSLLIDGARAGGDESTKLFLFAADTDDDIFDPTTWLKANPAIGEFRNLKEFELAARKARNMPSFEATFRNLYLNQRINSANSLVAPGVWSNNARAPDMDVFRRFRVRVGLDLSSRFALTAGVMSAEDEYGFHHILPFFWVPQTGLLEREQTEKVPYTLWEQQGYIHTTPGTNVDLGFVARWLLDICADYDVESIRFDRWRMPELKKELGREMGGSDVEFLPLHPFGQGFKDMSPAIETLEAQIMDGKLRHGGHPVLTFCMSNVAITKDPAGNRKFDKRRSVGHIDGAIALVMAQANVVAVNEKQEIPSNPVAVW